MEETAIANDDQKTLRASDLPQDILEAKKEWDQDYEEVDIFAWVNNLVQYVDELKIELFFFNKNYTVYRAKLGGEVAKQMRPLFLDQIMEFVLDGIDKGLIVRGFEEAEKEDNVLQRTKVKNVDKLVDTLNWLTHEAHNIEVFQDSEHDLKRIKGVLARCTHPKLKEPFYIIKSLPVSQLMKGHTAWMLKDNVFKPFDNMAALKIPDDNQLLVVNKDLFVFNQSKLKQLFGYDAKAAAIAFQKVEEIEKHYNLSFAEGMSLQNLVKGKPAAIKKLQKIEPGAVKQEDIVNTSDELGVDLMTDDAGAIIIMDDKDMTKFVNLLNDDYMESPMTGQRYEIIKKRPLKIDEEGMLMKEAGL